MFGFLRDKFSHLVVTLRVSLVTIFVSLFVVMMVTLFSVFYFHLDDLVQQAAYLLVEKDTYAIMNDLNTHLYPIEAASKFSAELINAKVVDVDDPVESQDYMIYFLTKFPLVDGVYWGDVDGNFIYARKELDGSITTEVINRRVKPAIQTYYYRDKEGKIIKQLTSKPDFDPRGRPWFEMALRSKNTVWTDIYVYAQGPAHMGISIASPLFQQNGKPYGVFSMDVRLDYLSRYVSTQKIGSKGEVFIVDDRGRLIASPQLNRVNPMTYYRDGIIELKEVSEPFADAFAEFQRHQQPMFIFKRHHEEYIAAFKKIPSLTQHGWYLGVVDPETDFTAPIQQLKILYVAIDVIVFVLSIVLISNLATRIVNPIKKLVKETEKVKNFNLEAGERVVSRIKEVIDLADALQAMKMGLRSFKKYVPATLVRQLIKVKQDARIGGTKREIAVFFSDINNFTAITEKTETNQFLNQVCDYFDAFSHAISEEQGTIDKYIGDAIMAFWGAPEKVSNPCYHAAKAALKSLQRERELNAAWQKMQKPALNSRVGIHFGEAIVGNIGSSERLNYTAVGDTVNTASRLVSANKLYGTTILVSEAVYHHLQDDFVLRLVDKVMLKGKAQSIAVYELLGEQNQPMTYDVTAYQQHFADAFAAYQEQKWDDAAAVFALCLRVYPDDTVAPIFIERCKKFTLQPPSSDWNGVWRLIEK